jgi:hypothetical protein
MWEKKDIGIYAGSDFKPSIGIHGAGLYRISGLNRSSQSNVSLVASSSQMYAGDSIILDISVQKPRNINLPDGSVIIRQNDSIIGILKLDDSGKAQYKYCNSLIGNYSLTATYSGNTEYIPQSSSSVLIEVKKKRHICRFFEKSVSQPEKNRGKVFSSGNKIR